MSEINVNPLDPELGIDWNIASGLEIISEKDQNALSWSQFLDKSLALNRRDNVIRTMEIEKQVDVLFEGTEKESENYSSGPFISSAQGMRSEEHTSELQSRPHLVCRLLLEKKKK